LNLARAKAENDLKAFTEVKNRQLAQLQDLQSRLNESELTNEKIREEKDKKIQVIADDGVAISQRVTERLHLCWEREATSDYAPQFSLTTLF